jgi:hypothetical protein
MSFKTTLALGRIARAGVLSLLFAAVLTPPTAAAQDHSDPTETQPVARPNNPEMTAIFEADQAARKKPDIDWEEVTIEDAARRRRVGELLDAGALHSGDDYYHAAFVFQHGDAPSDYLKAHALALLAVSRGKKSATWIAAATLDRYLMAIGQPQIYGTQFTKRDDGWSQEPYQRELLSDAIREASRVPPIAQQERQRSALSARESGE